MVRPGTIAFTAALGVLCMWAFASTASATIVPQQGIAGAKLGMSKTEVRAKLGKPRSASVGRNDFGPYTQYRYRHGLRVTFQGNATVTSVRTSGSNERTKDGVGVGSTEETLRAKYKVTCKTLVKSRSCYIGQLTTGQRVTEFQIRGGRITWVSVGIVID